MSKVNAQKESLKTFWDSRKLLQAHEKCVMKMNIKLAEKMTGA